MSSQKKKKDSGGEVEQISGNSTLHGAARGGAMIGRAAGSALGSVLGAGAAAPAGALSKVAGDYAAGSSSNQTDTPRKENEKKKKKEKGRKSNESNSQASGKIVVGHVETVVAENVVFGGSSSVRKSGKCRTNIIVNNAGGVEDRGSSAKRGRSNPGESSSSSSSSTDSD